VVQCLDALTDVGIVHVLASQVCFISCCKFLWARCEDLDDMSDSLFCWCQQTFSRYPCQASLIAWFSRMAVALKQSFLVSSLAFTIS
jgi:hypothetical protein